MEETSTQIRNLVQTHPAPGKNICDRWQNPNPTISGVPYGLGALNYEEKMKTINMKIQSHSSPVEDIVNISKRQLTTPEKSVQNKGLNFATTIKRISRPVGWGCRIRRQHLFRGVRPPPPNGATCRPWVATRDAWGRDPGGWAVRDL